MNALTGPDTAPLLSLAATPSKYPFAFELKTVPVVQKAFFPRRPPLSKETSVKLLNTMDQIHGVFIFIKIPTSHKSEFLFLVYGLQLVGETSQWAANGVTTTTKLH